MTFTKITEYKSDNGVSIFFIPIENVPGFSHKVHIVVSGKLVAKDWLGKEYNIAEKYAKYYYEKHQATVEAALAA